VGASGTPHLQGFVHFENAKTMSAIHKIAGWKRTALKPSLKPLSAIDYCKKGEQSHAEWEESGIDGPHYGKNAVIFERGAYKQGRRTELEAVYKQVKDGVSVDEIAWDNPDIYERAHKSLTKLEDIRLRKLRRSEMTEGIWIFGGTGCGKSEYAFNTYDDGMSYSYPYDNGWWDGYKCQSTIIIDEFRGQIPFNEILRMVDKHPNYYVRRRNREPMPFISKKVIITSALHPCEVFKNLSSNDSMMQLYRRFKIYKITIDNGLEEINPEKIEIDYASS
jgi:RNA helicase.